MTGPVPETGTFGQLCAFIRSGGRAVQLRAAVLGLTLAVCAGVLGVLALTFALAHPWLALAVAVLLAGRGINRRIAARRSFL